MPYQSKAQQRLFFAKEARGELPAGTAERWAHETPNLKRLPQHKRGKKGGRMARRGRRRKVLVPASRRAARARRR